MQRETDYVYLLKNLFVITKIITIVYCTYVLVKHNVWSCKTEIKFASTVLAKAVLTRPSVCSKSAIFREAWHIVNLQPCPCPLEALIPHIRAFK